MRGQQRQQDELQPQALAALSGDSLGEKNDLPAWQATGRENSTHLAFEDRRWTKYPSLPREHAREVQQAESRQ